MKVLIAVDDSECSEAVINSAMKRNWPQKTDFFIVTVLEPIAFNCGNSEDMQALIEEGTQKRKSTAQTLIEDFSNRLKSRFAESGGEIQYFIKEGSPKKEIVDFAIEFGADKILIGAQGHGACHYNLLGEVSRVVAATAPCTVEIIR